MRKYVLTGNILILILTLHAQLTTINPQLLKEQWPASWISCPGIDARAYGVYHFRKIVVLKNVPASCIIHISADNRYRLQVNGKQVCTGPARGDLYNWFFETVDIAPFLKPGANCIAALVWNAAEYAPVAQVTNQTALVVQADDTAYYNFNSDASWHVMKNIGWMPCSLDNGFRLHTYIATGPGDEVFAKDYPWGWDNLNYDDSSWKKATPIAGPVTDGIGSDNRWTLVPRTIPLMEERIQRIKSVRRYAGIKELTDFLSGNKPLTIPANSTVHILMDQTFNTVAYPELSVSRGKNAAIKITYAEALVDSLLQKGNRNEAEGRNIVGNYDIFHPDGGEDRLFRPLWIRTFRYVQVDIKTEDQPLVIKDFYGIYTGYPFNQKASFSSNDSSLNKIWDVGWRTARLCAGETYFDCPYYEQLQYEGDTRIQSLISLYVTGDDRLMRKAINDFYKSMVPIGLTQGRYPSSRLQVIPPFSLYWVSMIYDYWMLRKDDVFLRNYLVAIQGVLSWYEQRIDTSRHMLGPMNWWNFVDWNLKWSDGTPDGAQNGNSSVITLQYAYTLKQAAALFRYFGMSSIADHYTSLAAELNTNTFKRCFVAEKELMANTPEKNSFSQHAGIMAVLSGCIPEKESKAVVMKVLTDSSLSQATFYYRFYLTRAMNVAGMGDLYYRELKPWRNMLSIGLTTFAETPEPTRSDCHAWSASPMYDFLATICGIMPASPGFSSVIIKPALGELTEISGSMPHPAGTIKVNLRRIGTAGVDGYVELPKGIKGVFVWQGKQLNLDGGHQKIHL